jgi:hypothetical protein
LPGKGGHKVHCTRSDGRDLSLYGYVVLLKRKRQWL